MIKKILFFLIGLLNFALVAQNFGNEWINYNQKYYEFKVVETGVYRINFANLISAGIPVNTINPKNIQLYGRGVQIPIFIEGEADEVFNPSDFIDFYAEKNDGWLDIELYKGANNQPNPYYSLINDTATYYLTVSNSFNNLRYSAETANNFNIYTPLASVTVEKIFPFNTNYYDGETIQGQATSPEYVPTEGWMSRVISNSGSSVFTTSLNSEKAKPNGAAFLETAVTGQSDFGPISTGDHHLQVSFGNQLIDTVFEGYKLVKFQRSLSTNNLGQLSTDITYRQVNDLGAGSDRMAMGFAKLTYDHLPDAEGKSLFTFQVDDNLSSNKNYFKFTNFSGSAENYILELSNNRRIKVYQSGNEYNALIPNGGNAKKCVLYSSSGIKSVGSLRAVGQNGFFQNFVNTIPDSAYIMISHSTLDVEVLNYANYRTSTGHYPYIVDVNQLYKQYGYGVTQHPLAIRNYLNDVLVNSGTTPAYLFLIGKSIRAKIVRGKASLYANNLVPSIGNPATDNLFTAGLNGTGLEVAIPTGRISVNSNLELKAYLDKIRSYESAQPASWMKQALHFVGGKSLLETQSFENYMTQYSNTFINGATGGNVRTFKKTTAAPIQTTLADSISTLINQGVSMMTFFGHASNTGGFDINIDEPENLNNQGRYPLILGNACYTGDVHQEGSISTSEDYVIIPEKGAIGFVATVDLSYPIPLNIFSSEFYRQISNKSYGKSIAYCMQQSAKLVQTNALPELRGVILEMSLQGDPAMAINSFSKPDYVVTPSSVSISPREVTSEVDSFTVIIKVENIGKAIDDSLTIEVVRRFPNNRDTAYIFKISPVLYQSEYRLKLPTDLVNGIGENNFTITVDRLNEIPELNENNNRTFKSLIIRSGDLIPVYPYNYAIVPKQGVTLKASTAFAFEQERNYVVELDTTSSFTSAFKQTTTITSKGGVIEWSPTVLASMPDSAVYFWRVSKEADVNGNFNWKQFSFQYIPTKVGWGQDHFDQLSMNSFQFIEPNFTSKNFDFVDNIKQLSVVNIGNPSSTTILDQIKYSIDNNTRERNGCSVTPSFMIAILDSLSFEPWKTPYNGLNPNRDYGQANINGSCRSRTEEYFIYRTNNPTQMQAMRTLLLDTVPDGSYILVYSWYNIKYSDLNFSNPAIMQTFSDLGSTRVPAINDSIPFIFLVQKGNPGSVREVAGDSINDQIELKVNLLSSSTFGSIYSKVVGPALAWDSLVWRTKSLETISQDSSALSVFKYKNEETQGDQVLRNVSNRIPRMSLSSLLNATESPLLTMQMSANDELLQTPPQLDLWHVYYDPVPEGALNPKKGFEVLNDTVLEGDRFVASVTFENISEYNMDSILVNYSLITSSNRLVSLPSVRLSRLPADSSLIVPINIPTLGYSGTNTLLIDINPNNDQPEQYHFNNIGQLTFFVNKDNINPVMDVTFDGRRIINGELIGPEPEIVIELSDENKYLLLNDTANFAVYLKAPNEEEKRISFGFQPDGGQMEFFEGTLPKNSARIVFRPKLYNDGIYQLRAQANDKSGNLSGSSDYLVTFEIETKASISRLMNYPNPFTTSTRFVFTLTGTRLPDYMQIQIMTITGKVVKEIDLSELGPIRIGNNITDYAWDGTDEFGDRLANGVYLYRVRTNLDGESIEHRDTSADKYFKQGYGKMYLMR